MFAISRLTPSVAPDAAESTKRRLATQGKSSQALTFADLYTKFASKTGPESVNNKWAVLYLLKIISEDRKSVNSQLDSSVLLPNFGLNNAGSGGESRVLGGRGSGEKGRSNGVLLVSKDPENLGEIAFREFVNLVKEENELSEEALVRDVLYACQGIDGKYQSEVFAVAFAVLAAGAVILTLNVLLLGGHIIFFQSLSLLGYCLFPLDVGALICMVKDNVILKVVVVSITLAWSSWYAYPFMSSAVNPRRKALALYPVFLLYVSVGFLLKMQDGHILVIL